MTPYTRLRTTIAESHRGPVVGASEIAVLALYELRHGRTPLSMWEEHTGRIAPSTDNEVMWWGRTHESAVLFRYVRDHFDEDTARGFYAAKIRERSNGPFKVQTEFRRGCGVAHPDLLIEAGLLERITGRALPSRIVQAKSHGFHAARRGDDPDFGYDPEDMSQNGIPAAIFLQEQWELYCADLPEADVAALINTNDYREYGPVRADPKVQEQCLALAMRFSWHVERDIAPRPETWEDVCRLWPKSEETTAIYPLETPIREREGQEPVTLADMLASCEKAKGDEARAKRRQEDIKNAVGVLLGENSVLTDPEGNVLAKSRQGSRETVKLAELRKADPLLAAKIEPWISRASWRELRIS